MGRALICQAEHALLEEPARFGIHGIAIEAGVRAARSNRLGKQHHGANHLIRKLRGISEVQTELSKVSGSLARCIVLVHSNHMEERRTTGIWTKLPHGG